MTQATAEYVNLNYDRNVLLFIFTATLAVMLLVTVLTLTTVTSPQWFLLPVSWFVGAMMVWGVGKYNRVVATAPVSQRQRKRT